MRSKEELPTSRLGYGRTYVIRVGEKGDILRAQLLKPLPSMRKAFRPFEEGFQSR